MRRVENPIEGLRLKYLKKFHLDKAEEKIAKNTCVINALESLTAEVAPDPIRIKRVRDMKSKANIEFAQGMRKVVKKNNRFIVPMSSDLDEQMKVEEKAVKDLIRDARRSKSRFGKVLHQRPFRADTLSEQEVYEEIKNGNDVFVMGFVVPLIRVAHIAHVGLIGRFMYDRASLYPIKFSKIVPVRSIIFFRK